MKKIRPIHHTHFVEKLHAPHLDINNDHYDLFSDIIKKAQNFAIGPFFCVISSYVDLRVKWVSPDIGLMTVFSPEEWYAYDAYALFENFYHKEDGEYVLAAINFMYEMYVKTDPSIRNNYRFNIYARTLNSNREYRWTLIQPWYKVNSDNEISSALHLFYDLSHLRISSVPLLSIIDFNNEEVQFFKHLDSGIEQVMPEIPHITKREKEVLSLMARGYNSSDIAKKLYISYYTAENHKRNLRKKTNTKTSSELIAFVMIHNLLLL